MQSSWHEASTACWQEIGAEGRHGNLASIHSQEENDLLAAWLASRNSPDPWIGGTQDTCGSSLLTLLHWSGLARARDGSISWMDESALDFENWADGEPNSVEGDGEDCVQMYTQVGAV